MQHLLRKLSAQALPILAVIVAGCNTENPGTSVKIALAYDDTLGLDTAEVTLADRTQSARIAHQLLLLVPDQSAGVEMPVEVWGKRAGKRAAYGTTTAIPRLGKTVSASLTLTQCTPGCQGNELSTCTGATVTCVLGCSSDGDAHCTAPTPSNGIDPTQADPLNGTTTISASATFDTDTGMITGGLDRQQGTGIASGIGYFQVMASAASGAALGLFVFHNLKIDAAATVRFTGSRAAVLLVGDTAKIAGVIDVAAGHDTRSAPGPGGGAGASSGSAQGCGAGGSGTSAAKIDGGGGGGGAGGAGGDGGAVNAPLVGAGGPRCLPMFLEPLQGGSGGGRGGLGSLATEAVGGGGGGALQITALGSLEISGTINAGGQGGAGGAASATDGGGGGGGGAGGAVLLEAPAVIVDASAILAANGGGGGGGGGPQMGQAGEHGGLSSQTAQGGGGTELASSTGGSGGALDSPADFGGNGTTNGGGGGGAAGAIVIRGHTRTLAGTFSPRAIEDDVKPPQ
jgi:hypothetical protein